MPRRRRLAGRAPYTRRPMGNARRIAPRLALAAALLAAACGGGGERIEVAAASSLRLVLPRIVEEFERASPPDAPPFRLRFHGSQALATQIGEGAGADLFVSANALQASRLLGAGIASRPTVVAANRLVAAVREDAPWDSAEALAAPGVRIAVAAPSVPAGALAAEAIALLGPAAASGLRANVVTEDPSVRVVLSRLELGEADAAFVYRTDAEAAPGVRSLALPAAAPSAEYVAVLIGDAHPRAAALLAFLLTPEAQNLFRAAGFLPAVASVEAR